MTPTANRYIVVAYVDKPIWNVNRNPQLGHISKTYYGGGKNILVWSNGVSFVCFGFPSLYIYMYKHGYARKKKKRNHVQKALNPKQDSFRAMRLPSWHSESQAWPKSFWVHYFDCFWGLQSQLGLFTFNLPRR